ncbi:PREDICTED: uncharacterized protein LOC106102448 isoform X2 [Papilio polytes]|uniref:uncharacterized protein LOC106102448 isoform X2 n=1 Tax=Papilio polytes TaxID=76194 RepID=UPI0006769601|nr:PREDICTED: uncharacterized protein LOC106102448 isoform X2 [Papilio polytes]
MESLDDSNCPSMSDGLSLYERYMRSFNVVDKFVEENNHLEQVEVRSSSTCDYESSNSGGNIDLSAAIQADVDKHSTGLEVDCNSLQRLNDIASFAYKPNFGSDGDRPKAESSCISLSGSLVETSSATAELCLLNDKSDFVETDGRLSSDSKSESFKHSVFITSTMENSNNAVDSVPMFRDIRHSENVFKLPISELSFNGTIKHVQKLKPIVDPLTALSTVNVGLDLSDNGSENTDCPAGSSVSDKLTADKCSYQQTSDVTDDRYTCDSEKIDQTAESSRDSQYEDVNYKKDCEDSNAKWNLEQSYSSIETSFDSGVRSPDMFSDEEEEPSPAPEPFWNFIKDFEAYDKKKVRKIEETLQGLLPPPSVTTLKTDVTEMLKKYYCFLPAFNDDKKINTLEVNSMTPTKKVSFIHIPTTSMETDEIQENSSQVNARNNNSNIDNSELNTSVNDKSIELKMCTEIEVKDTLWPDLIKCRYFDVYYNISSYREKYEQLLQRYTERFVGGETDTSVNIYSGGLQSPNSASKRKALRLKMAQLKSPGRRLSHLARRRQAFCSAATINEKAQGTSSKMVLIDKKKLINSAERKIRRTPNKKTPTRRTPGKKTGAATPKTKSGGSSKKKAMRRLLMDTESLSRSQPTRETLKRALFVSPENRKSIPNTASSSVPQQTNRFRRVLFSSPDRAETKSMDGTISDNFLKRKCEDVLDNGRSKIAKSLSFGGDSFSASQPVPFDRRVSEILTTRNTTELNETHKKKLLWAVSEALRARGWRMSSPGFREKAAALARLTRRLLTLPPHAARLATPALSTSETMLKLARQYVYAIIQGRTVEECFQDEQIKLANESNKISGYISPKAYQLKTRQMSSATLTSQIKENTCSNLSIRQEQPKSSSKNILQDKLVNIDSNSNSSIGISMLDKIGLYKSNSMPSFEDAAKMRARRQISFDSVDFPKR